MTDDAEAAELEPSEELLAARALETGLVEEGGIVKSCGSDFSRDHAAT
jgi:hypothetical protein